MSELTIVSPHPDDVPFSLCLSLSLWRSLPLKLNVITVFTVSIYAPRASALAADFEHRRPTITSLRKQEDRRVFYMIDEGITLEALDLLDAPIRLGISVDCVRKPQSHPIEDRPEVEILSRHFRKYFLRGFVLAPLALGDHVDHLAVRAAAIKGSVRQRLGFYEDLPYAMEVSETSLQNAVSYAERKTGVPLKSAIIRQPRYVYRKRSIIRRYQSQISRDDATAIARFALKYGGGERIWIPKHGCAWRSLISRPHA
jgi:LmbE family N-acetylglucosaminyl deacetylase